MLKLVKLLLERGRIHRVRYKKRGYMYLRITVEGLSIAEADLLHSKFGGSKSLQGRGPKRRWTLSKQDSFRSLWSNMVDYCDITHQEAFELVDDYVTMENRTRNASRFSYIVGNTLRLANIFNLKEDADAE